MLLTTGLLCITSLGGEKSITLAYIAITTVYPPTSPGPSDAMQMCALPRSASKDKKRDTRTVDNQVHGRVSEDRWTKQSRPNYLSLFSVVDLHIKHALHRTGTHDVLFRVEG
jgi:hypothetical protein